MYQFIESISSGVSGKTKKGGQSQRRYERLREMKLNEYYTRVAEHVKKLFLEDNTVEGIVIGGPGPTKEIFIKGEYLDYRLKKKIIAVLDSGYSGEEGFRDVLDKMVEHNTMGENRTLFEKQLVSRFLRHVGSPRAVYGLEDVLKSIKRAEIIIATDDIEEIDILEEKSVEYGVDLEIISAKTESGAQFSSFGGIGAILKSL